MVENFEEITHELTDNEKKILPLLINGFKNYTQKIIFGSTLIQFFIWILRH